MAQNFVWPKSYGSFSNPSVGLTSDPAPTSATEIAGVDSGGDLIPILVGSDGTVAVAAASLPLPTGAATSANQATEIGWLHAISDELTAITGQLPPSLGTHVIADSLAVNIASDQVVPISNAGITTIAAGVLAQSVSAAAAKLFMLGAEDPGTGLSTILQTASGTNSLSVAVESTVLATGAATSALQTSGNTILSAISGKLPATLGQKAMAASLAVAIASDQGAIPASQSGTWNINNISGTVSLPTGAATEATLAAQSAKLPATLGQKAMAASMAVVIASDQSAVPVSASSLPLPAGAATAAKQPALGTAGTASADVITVQGIASMTALKVDGSAVTQPVSAASLPSANGRAKANTPVLNDYSSTPVTSGSYVQLIASTTSTANEIEIFDSSGQTLYLAVGAAASEVNQLIIVPGGNGRVPLAIPSGSRISVKATSTSATSGILVLNLYT